MAKAKPHTNLARAYYALDDKNTMACGFTERTRARLIIISNCQIHARTWYRWLDKPEDVRSSDRLIISLVLNQPVKELFGKQLNIPQS